MIRTKVRTSHKHYRCNCGAHIMVGDQYLEHVISPDHDDVGNATWWRACECRACVVKYDRWPIPNGGVDQRSAASSTSTPEATP